VLSERELRRALRRVPLIGIEGPFHRFVDLGFVHQRLALGKGTEVLAGLGAKMLGGRFTPRGAFETLYVATSAETARIEAESRITASGVVGSPSKPYVHFVIRGQLQMILDLNDPSVRQALKTTVEEIVTPWVMDQAQGKEARTQCSGAWFILSEELKRFSFRPARTDLRGAAWPSCPTG
jgi:RES domain-containing protein